MGLIQIYEALHEAFGSQKWWPISGGFSPAEWEVCVGAILTQNTNWKNVEKALCNLERVGITSIPKLIGTQHTVIEDAIRPSGFYRQKAERLRVFADFIQSLGGFGQFKKTVTRNLLLEVKGIGPETVDSILLYALERPFFVIDAYTKRVFTRMGFNLIDRQTKFGKPVKVNPKDEYELWRWFFESTLPKDVNIYKEYHALIVRLAKRFCRKMPLCNECPLNNECKRIATNSDLPRHR